MFLAPSHSGFLGYRRVARRRRDGRLAEIRIHARSQRTCHHQEPVRDRRDEPPTLHGRFAAVMPRRFSRLSIRLVSVLTIRVCLCSPPPPLQFSQSPSRRLTPAFDGLREPQISPPRSRRNFSSSSAFRPSGMPQRSTGTKISPSGKNPLSRRISMHRSLLRAYSQPARLITTAVHGRFAAAIPRRSSSLSIRFVTVLIIGRFSLLDQIFRVRRAAIFRLYESDRDHIRMLIDVRLVRRQCR